MLNHYKLIQARKIHLITSHWSLEFFQVRGTPASGKTTLLNLLWAHINAEVPGAVVHNISTWPKGDNTLQRIPDYPNPTDVTYLLFDEAQDTYWDVSFWNVFLKGYASFDNYRVILFCSYGSAGMQPLNYRVGTPMHLNPEARVSLVPNSEVNGYLGFEAIGLLFSRTEFDEVVKREHEQALDHDLQDQIFWWTGGHAGAVAALLHITEALVSFSGSI
jgi:hypothetical protein